MSKKQVPDHEDWDDDEPDGLFDNCPCCGREYDEIDREYQICHYCKFNANVKEENASDID